MMKSMCGVELIEKTSLEFTSLLGLEDTYNGLAGPSGVRWYKHVLKRIMVRFGEERWILK